MKRLLFVFIATWAVFCVLTVLGIALDKPPKGSFIAGHKLPFNHRIVAGDVTTVPLFALRRTLRPSPGRLLTSRDFVGRYVVAHRGIEPQQPIAFEQTANKPDFAPSHDSQSLAWLPLTDAASSIAASVDAGDFVDLCGDDAKKCAEKLSVAAVVCGTDGSACSVALWVTNDQRSKLIEAIKVKPVHVFIYPKGDSA